MPKLCQEPPVSSKAPNEDFKDMDVLRNFKIKIVIKNSEQLFFRDQSPYQNQDQGAKPQSGTSNIHQSPEDFKDMDVICTFKVKDREQKF